MIYLTKLNGTPFVLNADLIEVIEENPDTTIRLVDKNYLIVREPMDEVVKKVIEYRQATFSVLDRLHLTDRENRG